MTEPTEPTNTEDLALYMYPTCPYCRRVMTTLRRLGVEVEYRNIRENSAYRDELLEARGKTTVPVLRIRSSDPDEEDEWMPESADIIQYLADRFGDGEVPSGGLVDYLTDWRLLLIFAGVVLAVGRVAGCF